MKRVNDSQNMCKLRIFVVTPPGTKVPGVCLGQNARSSGSFVDRGVSRMGEESEWGITTCCFAFIPGIYSGAFPLIVVNKR